MITKNASDGTVKVWDPLVRIFHWSLVLSFFIAFFTEGDWIDVHTYAGYVAAGLIGFRIVWGIIGTHYARFSQFIKSPTTVIAYIKKMRQFDVPHYLGHNPAAGAMIIALLLSILLTAITGMSVIAADGHGPLAGTIMATFASGWMKDIHAFFANMTMLLVVLHIGGVYFSSLLEGENLPRAMITGRKKMREYAVDQVNGGAE